MYPHKGTFSPMGAPPNLIPTNLPIIGENQWMSQSAYQNMDLDKVDWAALAQQWIHMKETTGVDANDAIPNAPPPPRISNPIPDLEEKGEAPMEVEHDDDPVPQINENTVNITAPPPPPTNIFQTNSWNAESSSRSSHQKQWNRKGNRWNNSSNANHSKSQRMQPNDGYTSGQVFNNAKPTNVWATGPSSFVNPNQNPNDLRLHGLDANAKSGIQLEQIGLNAAPPLDAAQRKTLPAWIREGLEKMEREKQRQAERDREMKERDEKRRQEKLIEQNLLMQLNANESSPKLPAKSKFESDSDSDNDDTVNSDYSENMPKVKVTERTTVGSNASASANARSSMSTVTVPTFKPHRTKAEILTEIMLSVRKNLTEILLEVTNEEIHAIAQDTLNKIRTKGRKAQSVQKNALTAITPGLGLVGYYDSDASKSDDESESDGEKVNDQRASDNDSETELKRSIQRRKASFENKSIEIESYLAESEEKEKNWLEQDESANDDETKSTSMQNPVPVSSTKSTETQEKLSTSSKAERKGSRFSDAKSLMYNVASSQLVNQAISSQSSRQSSLERRPVVAESKRHDHEHDRKYDYSDDSDSSRKRSKHTSISSKSSRHRSKRDYSRSPSSRKHKKSSRRRSSSSSSDRSSYSRHSDRSRKRSKRERSSSDDQTSRSSQGSHKREKHSREKSYSRSHSYKKSRH